MTMAVDERDDHQESTPREAELQKQIDGLQTQMTDMQKAREAAENPELTSEVQSLKEKLGEHSKQLEQSAEKLNQLQTENATLRDQNKASNAASNKKRPFNARVRPMGNLDTPSTGEGNTNVTSAAGAVRERAEDHQIHDLEESDSEPKPEKEEREKTATKSSITAYLEQMFSKRLDAIQSVVERLPGVAPPIRRSIPDSYTDTPFTEEIASVEMPRKFSFPSIVGEKYPGVISPSLQAELGSPDP